MNNTARQDGVGSSVKRFDRSQNKYREVVQLEPSRLYFLSIFTTPEGEFLDYSFDVEAASDSHYKLSTGSEMMLRRSMDVPGSQHMTLAEAMVEYLRTHKGYELERLASRACVEEFHYYDYDFDFD